MPRKPIASPACSPSRWDRDLIREGAGAMRRAHRVGERVPLVLQAELAAAHATAATWEETDWPAIVALYDELIELQDTAVVALNRAVALAMAAGPAAALPLLDELIDDPALHGSHRSGRSGPTCTAGSAMRQQRSPTTTARSTWSAMTGAPLPDRRPPAAWHRHIGGTPPDRRSYLATRKNSRKKGLLSHVTRRTHRHRQPASTRVFDYLADGTHSAEWRTGVLQIERTSPAYGDGATYRQVLPARVAAGSTATTG